MKKMILPSVSDLETLSTHELASVVLLLRRLPDVPLADVTNPTSNGSEPIKDPGAVAARVRREPKKKQASTEIPDWVEE